MYRAGLRNDSPRSDPAVAIATFHPSPTPPSTCEPGTSTSSKNTSANPVSPSSCAMGRTVTPGLSMGTRKYVRPRWRWASGSVRNSPKIQWAKAPREHHVFCPLSTHASPSPVDRTVARLRMAARSLPASGSDHPWHQTSAPEAMAGRYRAFCCGVPNSNSVGARRKMPFCPTRVGAPAR